MQNISRFHLMYFGFDEKTQNPESYLRAKAELENCVKEVKKEIRKRNFQKDAVSYSRFGKQDGLFLSLCLHKNHLFLGLYNITSKNISFSDFDNQLARYEKDPFGRIKDRTCNTIKMLSEGKYYIGDKSIESAWEKTYPLLDKVIDYEEKLSRKSEFEQNLYHHALIADKEIDDMVRTFEKDDSINDDNPKFGHISYDHDR